MSLFRAVAIMILASLLSLAYPLAGACALRSYRDLCISPQRDLPAEASGALRADAKEVAELLNIAPMVELIRKEKRSGSASALNSSRSFRNMRMICLWKIFRASEEVRQAVGEINMDLASDHSALDSLVSRQQMVSNLMNTVNFMQGGILGIMKQAISYPPPHPIGAQEIGITTFSIGTLLSATNLFLPSLCKHAGESRPTMLVSILDPARQPKNADASYLWKYFNSPVPGSSDSLSRCQMLVKHWQSFGGLKPENVKQMLRTSANTEEVSRESTGILSLQVNLLHDMRTHIEEFDAALLELHRAITVD